MCCFQRCFPYADIGECFQRCGTPLVFGGDYPPTDLSCSGKNSFWLDDGETVRTAMKWSPNIAPFPVDATSDPQSSHMAKFLSYTPPATTRCPGTGSKRAIIR